MPCSVNLFAAMRCSAAGAGPDHQPQGSAAYRITNPKAAQLRGTRDHLAPLGTPEQRNCQSDAQRSLPHSVRSDRAGCARHNVLASVRHVSHRVTLVAAGALPAAESVLLGAAAPGSAGMRALNPIAVCHVAHAKAIAGQPDNWRHGEEWFRGDHR